jgi:predicted transcriptional regulator of viral defense system
MTVIKKAHRPVGARNRVLTLARRGSIVRTRDAVAHGVHAETIARMARAGVLERIGPGRYRLTSADVTEHHDLVLASLAVPTSIICLLSALHFYNLGTQLPHQVWIAVPRGARVPRLSFPPLRAVRMSPSTFSQGIEQHQLEGHVVRVYSLARTVADCFRFRNTIGLDVALEALKEAWRSGRLNLEELRRVAKPLRVHRVMQPYLETIVL